MSNTCLDSYAYPKKYVKLCRTDTLSRFYITKFDTPYQRTACILRSAGL